MFIYIFPPPRDLQPCGSTIRQFLQVNIQNEYKFKECDAKLLAFIKWIEIKVKHTMVNRDCCELRRRQNALIVKKR